MAKFSFAALSRRERQIMEIVYARRQATAGEIQAALADPPSYSTVRTLLRVLEEKGHLTHVHDGPRYLYKPRVSAQKAKRSALDQLIRTFFNNSASSAMVALLDMSAADLSPDELERLAQMIRDARKQEKTDD